MRRHTWTRSVAVALSFLCSAPALAQVAGQVQITTMLESETGGCYVGTAGPDATMFLRLNPGGTGCDTQDFNPNLCVTRLETAGDQPNGTIVSFGDSSLLRPSVAGDGSFTWYSTNIDLCLFQTNTVQQDICFNLPPTTYVHFTSVSPSGGFIVMVPRDLGNINVAANVIQLFQASFPTLPLLGTYQFFSPVIYPDSVDIMGKGEWAVFDASTSPFPGGNWGLYVVNLNTGELRTLVAPIAGFELRNPAFAQTSDEVIAFDAWELSTGVNTVLTANIVTGDVREVAQTSVLGVPGFNGDDSALIFDREDAATFSTVSMRSRALATDRITPVGAEQPWIANAGYGVVYRRGTWDTTAVVCQTAIPGVIPGGTVQINRNPARGSGVLIDISWDPSCSNGASAYSIHEGAIGSWYSHEAVECLASGTAQTGYTPQAGNRYFLVVPVTDDAEGSYGVDSAGMPRPVSTTTCLGSQITDVCP